MGGRGTDDDDTLERHTDTNKLTRHTARKKERKNTDNPREGLEPKRKKENREVFFLFLAALSGAALPLKTAGPGLCYSPNTASACSLCYHRRCLASSVSCGGCSRAGSASSGRTCAARDIGCVPPAASCRAEAPARPQVVVSATRLELARLELVVDAWNQVLGWAGLCLASGSARRIAVAMPWAAPLPSGSRVEVHGLRATLQRLPVALPTAEDGPASAAASPAPPPAAAMAAVAAVAGAEGGGGEGLEEGEEEVRRMEASGLTALSSLSFRLLRAVEARDTSETRPRHVTSETLPRHFRDTSETPPPLACREARAREGRDRTELRTPSLLLTPCRFASCVSSHPGFSSRKEARVTRLGERLCCQVGVYDAKIALERPSGGGAAGAQTARECEIPFSLSTFSGDAQPNRSRTRTRCSDYTARATRLKAVHSRPNVRS